MSAASRTATAAAGPAVPSGLVTLAHTVAEAIRRLDALAVAPSPASTEMACRIGAAVSAAVAALAAEQMSQQSALASPLLALRDRLESNLLAGSLLEASHASATAVVDVVRRGLAAADDDLARF